MLVRLRHVLTEIKCVTKFTYSETYRIIQHQNMISRNVFLCKRSLHIHYCQIDLYISSLVSMIWRAKTLPALFKKIKLYIATGQLSDVLTIVNIQIHTNDFLLHLLKYYGLAVGFD